ncbi:MAG: VWA domain-containing protein [Spirochaetales bacterium]|nr:VWA domain-containing protein [Spirochaetales bacterium]
MGIRFDTPMILFLIFLIPVAITVYRNIKNRTKRFFMASLFRLCAFALFVFALAGLQVTRAAEQVNVAYILDLSDSIPEHLWHDALDRIRLQMKKMTPRDTSALIVFGREPSIEFTPRSYVPDLQINSIVSKEGTDIGKAIYAAMGAFPEKGENRIVLFTDGLETNGNARQAARIASRAGIQIETVALGSSEPASECFIRNIVTPFSVNVDQTHDLQVHIGSTVSSRASLTFLTDGEYRGESEINLEPGDNIFTYTSTLDSKGTHTYEVVLTPGQDTIPENNYYSRIIHVSGASSLLYVHQKNKISRSLLNALRSQDYLVDSTDSWSLPDTFSGFVQYDGIIFDNVPAYDLSFKKMELIESYVRNTGGGFFMIGGDSSFGLGGYYKSPIEKMLPVNMDVSSTMDIPSMSLLMVVDKSGSMSDRITASQTKLDLVKEAVLAATETLNPYYQVASIAFDANFEWALPPTTAGNNEEIFKKISELETGGGTILYPALEEALTFLGRSESAVKHLIILSDGLTESADFEKIIRDLSAADITVSTVAVGNDSDQVLMRNIAMWGNGRAYFTSDIRNIPQIFASETLIASRGIMIDDTFLPVYRDDDEILEGIGHDFPVLGGFVLTYNKPGARQLVSATGDNPLLSKMQYGLGKTVAFTSDLKGAWGTEWLKWDAFPRFISQLTRWMVRPQSQLDLYASINREGSKGTLQIDAVNADGKFLNNLDLKTRFIQADGSESEYPVNQVAPGLYEFNFSMNDEGVYFFSVFNENNAIPVTPRSWAYALPYSTEYIPAEADLKYLEEISGETGGKLFGFGEFDAADMYAARGKFQVVMNEMWPLLLFLALAFLLADLAVRRQILPDGFFNSLALRLRSGNRKYSYDELQDIIRRKKEEEKPAHATRNRHWFEQNDSDPGMSARLYLARKRKKDGS